MGDNIPNSLRLIKTVKLEENRCSSVCSSHKGITYVRPESGSGIYRINEHYQVDTILENEIIQSFTVYNGKIYALIVDSRADCEVRVYNLDGNRENRDRPWIHAAYRAGSTCQLTIVDNQVVILNVAKKEITTYSLAGEVLRSRISCPLPSQNPAIYICAAGKNCLAVSDYDSSQVFKFDLTTEKVINWTCKPIIPRGVTYYRDRYLLVTDVGTKPTVYIGLLDVQPG